MLLSLPVDGDVIHEQVDAAAESIASDRITPVFAVSNVTGTGLPLLRAFVARLRRNKARNDDSNMPVGWTPLSIMACECGLYFVHACDNKAAKGLGAN